MYIKIDNINSRFFLSFIRNYEHGIIQYVPPTNFIYIKLRPCLYSLNSYT